MITKSKVSNERQREVSVEFLFPKQITCNNSESVDANVTKISSLTKNENEIVKNKQTNKNEKEETINKKPQKQLTIEEAFKTKSRDHKEHKFIFANIVCPKCVFGSAGNSSLVVAGDKDHCKFIKQCGKWFDGKVISSFASLLSHDVHCDKTQLVLCPFPVKPEKEECHNLNKNAESVVSVFHSSSHCVVMVLSIDEMSIKIFDGLSYPLTMWQASKNIDDFW